jgi:hypothetical protein
VWVHMQVQAAAAAAMGGVGLLGLAIGAAGIESWPDLLTVRTAFWVFMVCSTAGASSVNLIAFSCACWRIVRCMSLAGVLAIASNLTALDTCGRVGCL